MIQMKKLILIFAVLFALSFTSCEPNSIAEDETNTQFESTDKGEVGSPGSDPADPDEDTDD